jgi:hypothetical protein
MQTKTALAVAGCVLAVPSAALAATDEDALHPSGKLTHDPVLKHRLIHENVRLSHKLERRPHLRRLRTLPVSVLRDRNRHLRKRVAQAQRHAAASATTTTSAPLQAIAACESGNNAATDTGNGFYGKYQFTQSTWQSVGGTGNPAAASEAEQDQRAAMLYSRTGAASWPVCGR